MHRELIGEDAFVEELVALALHNAERALRNEVQTRGGDKVNLSPGGVRSSGPSTKAKNHP